MARRRPPLFGGNTTLAGALVTSTACLATLSTVGTGCYLFVAGDAEGGREALAQGVGFAGIAVALLSRTRQDPAATVERPATITATPSPDAEPVGG